MPPSTKHLETREAALDLVAALEERGLPIEGSAHHTTTPLDGGPPSQRIHLTLPAATARALTQLLRNRS